MPKRQNDALYNRNKTQGRLAAVNYYLLLSAQRRHLLTCRQVQLLKWCLGELSAGERIVYGAMREIFRTERSSSISEYPRSTSDGS